MPQLPPHRAPRRADWSRRAVLAAIGAATGAATVGGCRSAVAQRMTDPGGGLDCLVTPQQTEGPYFVDARLERADIRLDPATGLVKDGLPLRLRVNCSRVDGGACTPLEGAYVDLWQCDALGVYSDVRDFQGLFDTRGQQFLRGYQATDRHGAAEFLTIYPGWYSGRAVHIHFKVRTFAGQRESYEFTSQLYFDDAITDVVHGRSPYRTKGPRDTRNDLDRIYRAQGSGSKLLLRLSPDGQGYRGTIGVGLRMS
jgi:protocatechuate 3,4-dioxygenase beta subunit